MGANVQLIGSCGDEVMKIDLKLVEINGDGVDIAIGVVTRDCKLLELPLSRWLGERFQGCPFIRHGIVYCVY